MSEHHPAGHAHHHAMHHPDEPPAKPGYPEHPEQHDPREGGHDKHEGHSVEMFRNKFWVTLLLTIPTVIWGHMLMRLTGFHAPAFAGSQWIAPVFGTAVFFYGGLIFVRGAI